MERYNVYYTVTQKMVKSVLAKDEPNAYEVVEKLIEQGCVEGVRLQLNKEMEIDYVEKAKWTMERYY